MGLHSHVPFVGAAVVSAGGYLVVEFYEAVHGVFFHGREEVGLDFWGGSVETAPGGVGVEGVLVGVCCMTFC